MMYPFMKYNEIEEGSDTYEALIASDGAWPMSWVAEQKFDGTRVAVKVTASSGFNSAIVEFFSNGKPLKHTAATQHIGALTESFVQMTQSQSEPFDYFVVEGELIIGTGELILFDLVEMVSPHTVISPSVSWAYRRQILESLFRHGKGEFMAETRTFSGLALSQVAWSTDAKLALVERVRQASAEGVIFKRCNSTYEPGTRVDHVLKLKFVKTADVIIVERTSEPNSAVLAAYGPDGELVTVGKCSMIGKPGVVGDVIEVRYLYWTGSSVYQPRLMRVRDDKTALECSTDQFVPYSRAVV